MPGKRLAHLSSLVPACDNPTAHSSFKEPQKGKEFSFKKIKLFTDCGYITQGLRLALHKMKFLKR